MKVTSAIVNGCRQNNRLAQEQLYKLLYADLMQVALLYVVNQSDAEDVLNKSMLKVFKKIAEFEGTHENFGGWIRRIVVHESIDFIRSRKSFNEKHITLANLPEGNSRENWMEEDPGYILKLLDSLSELEKAVFNLSIIEGYSHKEISSMLNVTVANSKWNLHTARKKMKKWIIEKELA